MWYPLRGSVAVLNRCHVRRIFPLSRDKAFSRGLLGGLLISGVWEAEGMLWEAVTRRPQGSRAGKEPEAREGGCRSRPLFQQLWGNMCDFFHPGLTGPVESGLEALFKGNVPRTSLVVQRLRLHTSNAGGAGSTPGRGTEIPHAMQPKKKKGGGECAQESCLEKLNDAADRPPKDPVLFIPFNQRTDITCFVEVAFGGYQQKNLQETNKKYPWAKKKIDLGHYWARERQIQITKAPAK